MERTLSIIKPDAVGKGIIGEVIKRLENNNMKIVAMKMIKMTKSQAEGFYAVHRGKPFFDSLTDFMTSGPAVVMILEGDDIIRGVITSTEEHNLTNAEENSKTVANISNGKMHPLFIDITRCKSITREA